MENYELCENYEFVYLGAYKVCRPLNTQIHNYFNFHGVVAEFESRRFFFFKIYLHCGKLLKN